MLSKIRRVVTGHTSEGKSVFLSDGTPPRCISFDSLPGLEFVELWATEAVPAIPGGADLTESMTSFLPGPTGSRFRVVRFPSGLEREKLSDSGFDPMAFRTEYAAKIPGLAEAHETDDPSMHATDTIDYGIILSGEIYLELDNGQQVHLTAGDCIVQNGTRHAWRNRSSEPCVVAFIMIGATR
jgi:mannose-6-phosphate isomerase-like protein (cupin superfamily)